MPVSIGRDAGGISRRSGFGGTGRPGIAGLYLAGLPPILVLHATPAPTAASSTLLPVRNRVGPYSCPSHAVRSRYISGRPTIPDLHEVRAPTKASGKPN